MSSITLFKQFYEELQLSSLQILQDPAALAHFISPQCLVLLLRFLENIHSLGTSQILQTLILLSRLLKINSQAVKQMLPFHQFSLKPLPQNQGQDDTNIKLLLVKLTDYVNCLLSEAPTPYPSQQQLRVLTRDLSKLKYQSGYSDVTFSKLSQIVYWIAEEELFQLWVHIEHQLPLFQHYGQQEFQLFYYNYSLFCTHRRKIHSIRHQMLRSVKLSAELNKKVEIKLKDLKDEKVKFQSVNREGSGRRRLLEYWEDEEEDI